MATRNAKTILVRSFIIEHNGVLVRYTEKIEELAKINHCEVIDLTVNDDENETDYPASPHSNSSHPKFHQVGEIGIACFDDDLQPFLKKRKVDGNDQSSSNFDENAPESPVYTSESTIHVPDSPIHVPDSPIHEPGSPVYEPASPQYFRPLTPAYAYV